MLAEESTVKPAKHIMMPTSLAQLSFVKGSTRLSSNLAQTARFPHSSKPRPLAC
jgi:hypothetical protein